MIIKGSRLKPIIYTLLAFAIGSCFYTEIAPADSQPVTINSNVSIPKDLLDEATFENELGLILTKRNTKANNQWKQVVKSGGIFDCFRPLGEYEFNSGQWVTPGVVTYRNVKGEHLFSFIVELFYSHHNGKFTFEGLLKENLTLDYNAEGFSMPLNYFSNEPALKSGNCIVPINKKRSLALPLPTFNPNRYHSLLVSYYIDVIEPKITSIKGKLKSGL